jgi:hypothetical protein
MTLPHPRQLIGVTCLPDSRIALRYGVCLRTVKRWRENANVRFPKPDLRINGRAFTSESTLNAFDDLRRQQASPPPTATTTATTDHIGERIKERDKKQE